MLFDDLLAIARRSRIARELEAAKAAVNELPDEAFFDDTAHDGGTIGIGTVLVDDPEGDLAELVRLVAEHTGTQMAVPAEPPVTQLRIDALERSIAALTMPSTYAASPKNSADDRYSSELRTISRARDDAIAQRDDARRQLQRSLGYIDRILEQEHLLEERPAQAPVWQATPTVQRGPRIDRDGVPF